MDDKFKIIFPFIILLIIFASLVNLGVLPGKKALVKFLGVTSEEETPKARPLDFVPAKIQEAQPKNTEPRPLFLPSPSPSPSPPSTDGPSPPPPPPPGLLGVSTKKPPPPPDYVFEETQTAPTVENESYWQTIKRFFDFK